MSAATIPLTSVDDFAVRLLQKFRPGLLRLAARAGWGPEDLQGVAWLAAAEALAAFDPSKGNLEARGWWACRQQARGFLPPAGELDELDGVIGGDDPAAILEAVEEVDSRLLGLGAGVEREARSERTARRYRARARGAAAMLLAGGDGRQSELF